jgi:hypothetical protein
MASRGSLGGRQARAVAVDDADPAVVELEAQAPRQQAAQLRLVDVAVDRLHRRVAAQHLERVDGREVAGVDDQVGGPQGL